MFDVKAKVDELVKKITSEKDLAKKFVKEPVKTVEGLLGVDLPDENVKKVIEGVKEKISLDKLGKLLDSDGDGKPDLGALGKITDVFKK